MDRQPIIRPTLNNQRRSAEANRQRVHFHSHPNNTDQRLRYASVGPILYYENLNLLHLRWLHQRNQKLRNAETLGDDDECSSDEESPIVAKQGQQMMREIQRVTRPLPNQTGNVRPPPPPYFRGGCPLYLQKPFVPLFSFRLSCHMRLEDVAKAVSGYENKVTAFEPYGGEWYYIRQEKEFGWNRAVESFGHCSAKLFTKPPYGSGVMRVKRQEDFCWVYI